VPREEVLERFEAFVRERTQADLWLAVVELCGRVALFRDVVRVRLRDRRALRPVRARSPR
jgi:hypothetical protein